MGGGNSVPRIGSAVSTDIEKVEKPVFRNLEDFGDKKSSQSESQRKSGDDCNNEQVGLVQSEIRRESRGNSFDCGTNEEDLGASSFTSTFLFEEENGQQQGLHLKYSHAGLVNRSFKHSIVLGVQQDINIYYQLVKSNNGKIKVLGSGMEGEVYFVKRKVDQRGFALKSFDVKSSEAGISEINYLRSLDHPNVVSLYEIFRADEETYYISCECGLGGNLRGLVGRTERVDERICKRLFRDILGALSYLHVKNIIHRDIKLENFVFRETTEDGSIMMIDFGLSTEHYHYKEPLKDIVGTIYYISPEMLNRRYSFSTDMWSFGVMAYEMLTSKRTFGGRTDKDITKSIQKSDDHFKEINVQDLSPKALDFLKRLLVRDVSKRLTASQALKHPFLTGENNDSGFKSVKKRRGSSSEEDFILNSIREFLEQPKLKQIVLQFVARELPFGKKSWILPYYKYLTSGFPGIITFETLEKKLPKASVHELHSLFVSLDYDISGYLEWNEIVAIFIRRKDYTKDKRLIANIFRKLTLPSGGNGINIDALDWFLGHNFNREKLQGILDEALEKMNCKSRNELSLKDFAKLIQSKF